MPPKFNGFRPILFLQKLFHVPITETAVPPSRQWEKGLIWAFMSPLFLGTIPILAKLAYAQGVNVLTVVAFRTLFAALILWLYTYIFHRKLIITSGPAVWSSILAGAINGFGSLFYYSSLTRIDAAMGQLINITYLIFVTILLRLAGHTISLLTLLRTLLAVTGIYLITVGGLHHPNWVGVGMMLFAAFTFAVQLVLSQRILLDIPAQTMALYAMTAMASVVTVAWLIFPSDLRKVPVMGWGAILGMGVMTGISRLTLFLGVKHLGSIQTALLNILEVVVSVVLAILFLNEHLTLFQWGGAVVLLVSVLLVRYEKGVPRLVDWWQTIWRWQMRWYK